MSEERTIKESEGMTLCADTSWPECPSSITGIIWLELISQTGLHENNNICWMIWNPSSQYLSIGLRTTWDGLISRREWIRQCNSDAAAHAQMELIVLALLIIQLFRLIRWCFRGGSNRFPGYLGTIRQGFARPAPGIRLYTWVPSSLGFGKFEREKFIALVKAVHIRPRKGSGQSVGFTSLGPSQRARLVYNFFRIHMKLKYTLFTLHV